MWGVVVIKMNTKITITDIDQRQFEKHPPPSTVVIHISSFAIIKIIGFDPKEVRQGNLAIIVTLLRFFIKIAVWLKVSHDDWS